MLVGLGLLLLQVCCWPCGFTCNVFHAVSRMRNGDRNQRGHNTENTARSVYVWLLLLLGLQVDHCHFAHTL